MSLTKSLHTVTAVTNVARFIQTVRPYGTAEALLQAALVVLGYSVSQFPKNDDTVERCRAAVAKVLAE